MPGNGSGSPHSTGTVDGDNGRTAAEPVLQVLQPPDSPPVPQDVVEIVSPLILGLAEHMGYRPVAVLLPVALLSDGWHPDQAAALCALTPDASEQGWAGRLVEAALGAKRQMGDGGDLPPIPMRIPIYLAQDGQVVDTLAWPLSFDAGDPGALVLGPDGSEDGSNGRLALVGGCARAISAGLRVVHAQRSRERASMALLEVARTAGSTLQLEEVLSLVTERTAKLVGADRCGLWLLEKQGATLLPSAMYGMPAEFVREWSRRPLSLDEEPLSKEAIRTERPVLVSDAPNDPRTDKNAVRFFGDKTILVLPVIAKGQVQGTLFINHVGNYHRYSRAEIETAMAIANQAAIAIQNARLYREVEEWNSQLERLQAIMSKLSRSNSVSSIANIIADELQSLIPYDSCRVWVVQEDTNELVPLAILSSSREYSSEKLGDLHIEVGQGVTGHVAAAGIPQLVGDVERDPRAYHVPGTLYLDESMVAAPIKFEGRVIGVITLSRLGLDRFSQDDLRLLDVFANEAAIEFENARLYQETQKKGLQLLSAFHRVGDALATGLDPNQTLQIIVDMAAEMVRAKACALLLVDEADGELVFRASKGLSFDMSGERMRAGRGMSWEVVMEGSPKVVPDIAAIGSSAWMLERGVEDLRSYLGVPLVLQGRTIGVLSVFGGRQGQFAQADVELLSSFAHQAAIAIRNAQLFTSLQERVRELTGLAEISQSTATLTNLDDTYRELTRSIAQLLHANGCVLLLARDASDLEPQQPAFGFTPEELALLKLRVEEAAAVPGAADGTVQAVDGLVVNLGSGRLGRAALMAPMRTQDRLIGAVLVTGRPDGSFNENDVRLLTILAAHAAVIVQNAILYQSVERERDELDTIIRNTSDAIILVDEQGCVGRVNAAAEGLMGWRVDEMLGRRCAEALSGDIPPDVAAGKPGFSLQEVVENRDPVPYFESVVVTPDGVKRDVAASYSFVRTAGGEGGLGVIIARDISKLREVDRMKSEFVSMVSHELRTPLGLIKGYASTLLNPQLSIDEQTVERFLMGIDGAADRLARLIENLLSVSRIESGLFRLSTQQVDLSQLVRQSVATVKVAAKGRTVEVHIPRRAVKVEGDRVQLELVMDNLLGNAVKYSPMGKPIKVTVAKRAGEVEVRVIDNGIGIAAHHLPRVFDKFYRVEGGYSKRTPGSGLGLYICQSIIDAHGGRIWAESKLGEGSIFAFVLPVSQLRKAAGPDSGDDPVGKPAEEATDE